MDGKKILEVINIYKECFKSLGVIKAEYLDEENPPNRDQALSHCCWMLEQMEIFVQEGRIQKAFRWLGFVQCSFWVYGIYSKKDLKNHSRP